MVNAPRFYRQLRHATRGLVATALLAAGVAHAGGDDIIYANGFEGFELLGGTISGRVLTDPDNDGALDDGVPVVGATVFLDADFDGRFDPGEAAVTTNSAGAYRFVGVSAGIKHVRQILQDGSVQTFPGRGSVPLFDGLPDAIDEYRHALPGVGEFDEAYGENASDWPAGWGNIESSGSNAEPVDPAVVLKPIGVRGRVPSLLTYEGSEFLTLPTGAYVTVRFDEPIADGPGPDLLVHSITSGIADGEIAEILVGSDGVEFESTGFHEQSLGVIPIDLADLEFAGAVHFVRVVSQNNGGGWPGFELVGLEALNIAAPDASAHVVNVTPAEYIFEDRDFGRYFEDRPPEVVVVAEDDVPATPGLRAGESATVRVFANDDLALASVQLLANGIEIPLDESGSGVIGVLVAGELVLNASAEDSIGQRTVREARYQIANSDGSPVTPPGYSGPSEVTAENAPRLRIIVPAIGADLVEDQEVIGSVEGTAPIVSWTLEFAPIEQVDPFDLGTADPDYTELGAGSGEVFSAALGLFPASSLPDGIYLLRLGATDDLGRTAWYGHVVAKNVPENTLRPEITIESPVIGDRIGFAIDVIGSIESVRAIIEWSVEYALAEEVDLGNVGAPGPAWRRIAEGSGSALPGSLLGAWDASLVEHGSYVIRVVARNDIGLGRAEGVLVEVAGAARLGRNRLEFEDIDLELGGMNLQFVRVYDSLDAAREGDLGFGWTLRARDADIRETVPDTGTLGLFGSTPLRDGTRVYIDAPSGDRLAFTFRPQAADPTPLGTPYRATFEPDPGNYYRLEVPEGNDAFLSLRSDGNVYLFFVSLPYNPTRYVLIAPDGTRYLHDETAGLLQVTDRSGNSLTYGPDGVEHSSGARLDFARDTQGRITEVTGPDGSVWSYSYDAAGNLASFTDPDLQTSVYTYLDAPAHYLASVFDPQGRLPIRYEYDPDSGRLIAIIDEMGNRQEADYDLAAFSGTNTDARGNTTSIDYDERGNILRLEDPLGNVTFYEYGDPGNPDRATRVVDPAGEAWIYEFSELGKVVSIETPMASFGNLVHTASYDEFGNMLEHSDAMNRTSTYGYDDQGNRTLEQPYGELGWQFEYATQGRPIRRELGEDFAVDYEYDEFGLLASHADPTGYQAEFVHEPNGQLVSRSDGNGTLDVAFSPGGLLNQQVDPQGSSISLIRNMDGSLSRTDRTASMTTIDFDSLQRPSGLELPNGGIIATGYDPDGNPASLVDAVGNVSTMVHDANDRLVGWTDASGNARSMAYDGVGNLVEIIDRNGRRRTFEYDSNRRMTAERWHDSGGAVVREILFFHDNLSGLNRVEDTRDGETLVTRYLGALPRVVRVEHDWPGEATVLVRYSWNDQARFPISIGTGFSAIDLASIRVDDYAGMSYGLSWTHSGASGSGNYVIIRRDPDGAVRSLERRTGFGGSSPRSLSRYEYDSRRWVESIRHENASGLLLGPMTQLDYQRDLEGRILRETHADNQADYLYDPEGQLTAVTHSNPTYADELYAYDLAGNRTASHHSGSAVTIDIGNRTLVDGELTLDYDAEGNVIRRTDATSGQVIEFSYDHRNRMIRAEVLPALGSPPDVTWRFDYDHDDRMIYRSRNGEATWIINDRHQPIAEFRAGTTTLSAAFLYDPSGTDEVHAVWREDALGERWFLHDQLGSVRGVTDSNFNLLGWVDYSGFGRIKAGATPVGDEPIRFAARPTMVAPDIHHNRRRFLDSRLGRFLQEDPTRFGGRDWNLYRYAYNHPLGISDPSGEIAAINQADLLIFVLELGKLNADNPDDLAFPCHIAHWSATNFAYFGPVAELVLDPPIDGNAPQIEKSPIYELTGCNAR